MDTKTKDGTKLIRVDTSHPYFQITIETSKETVMETSKIRIRPFIPYMKDEKKEGREPFAVLKYGNVEVELDYTIMQFLTLDIKSDLYCQVRSIARAAFDEIIKEMDFYLSGKLPSTHRDNDHPFLKSITANPLHPVNTENVTYIYKE